MPGALCEKQEDGEHVDGDVSIPAAVARELLTGEAPGGAQDAADAPADADAGGMSEGKQELIPLIEGQLRAHSVGKV